MKKWWKQLFCNHVVNVHRIGRPKSGGVVAYCVKCGKKLTAEHGLGLKAQFCQ